MGKWIKTIIHTLDDVELHRFTCSVCGRIRDKKTRYCPGCGEEMENGYDR